MAEFDPTAPKDAAEAAYAQALLDDEAGRKQRHARLMAALPRPEATAAVPVSRSALAWRWQPYALGLLATGLLLAAALALRGRSAEPRPEADPRLAAAQPASTATVVAQASPAVAPPPLSTADAPRTAAKVSPTKPRATQPASVVVADAALPHSRREAEAGGVAAEPTSAAMLPPPAAPAAPEIAAASPKLSAESVVPHASSQAEVMARTESVSSGAVAREWVAPRAAHNLAASGTGNAAKAIAPGNADLLLAVTRADLAAARSALKAGASAHLRDAHGRTLLMLAARTGSREVVDLLLAAGARKADRDPQGWTAADHAQGHGDLVDHLR
jgi:Ankyrin repeats (3 copies)